jgi:Holliday junction resolvase
MRTKAKVDDNQAEIVEGLRKAGVSVVVTSSAGKGFTDIVVGFRGENYLIEIKDGNKPPAQRKLTPDQVKFHREWKGQIAVANNLTEAFKIIGLLE